MKIELVTLHFHVDGYLVERRAVAMVELEPGERVRDAIAAGAQAYGGDGEMYAFVRAIPAGATEFTEVQAGAALVTVVQASWVPSGAVAVGRAGRAVRLPVHTGIQKYMEVAGG
jgi:hypothetical protein